MKLLTLSLIIILSSTFIWGQLKVDKLGHVGIGTPFPNPDFQMHVKGNILLTNYPKSPNYALTLKIDNGDPGTEIGSSVDKLAFWSTYNDFNKLYAEKYYTISDIKYKKNCTKISDPLKKVMSLNPMRYSMVDTVLVDSVKTVNTRLEYGFISQDVEKSLSEVKITDDMKGAKLLDYTQIIPLAVASIQEQNKVISKLESQVAILTANVNNVLTQITTPLSNPLSLAPDASKLLSSVPNPFSTSTNLKYYLTNVTTTAEIKVWDMLGTIYKTFTLNIISGNGQVTLQGSDLPINGKYVYALFVDGQIVDAKYISHMK